MKKMTEDLFWPQVDVTTNEKECWRWQGKQASGYGYLRDEGKLTTPHRWVAANYPTSRGDQLINLFDPNFVHHVCKNRLCCNPLHLYLTTNGTGRIIKTKPKYAQVKKLVAKSDRPKE